MQTQLTVKLYKPLTYNLELILFSSHTVNVLVVTLQDMMRAMLFFLQKEHVDYQIITEKPKI